MPSWRPRLPPPVLHVHVSGSAGTLLCNMAQLQIRPGYASGRSLNCIIGMKNPAGISHYGMHPERLVKKPLPFWNCSELRTALDYQHYWVMGAVESFLDEWNHPQYAALIAEFMATNQSRCSRSIGSVECCGCTLPSTFFAGARNPTDLKLASSVGMLIVERGSISPLGDFWSASEISLAQPPLGAASLCRNLRYTFLMHDPLRRAATLLLERCPYGRRVWHCESQPPRS